MIVRAPSTLRMSSMFLPGFEEEGDWGRERERERETHVGQIVSSSAFSFSGPRRYDAQSAPLACRLRIAFRIVGMGEERVTAVLSLLSLFLAR